MTSREVTATMGMVRLERVLPGPADRVWDYLTRPALLATWLAEGEIELHVGGYVELRFARGEDENAIADGAITSGVVTHCEPPESLACYLTDASCISNVTFEIEPRGSQILLLVTHARLPQARVAACQAGWAARLDVLEQRLQACVPHVRATPIGRAAEAIS